MSLVTGKKLQSIGSKIIRVDINILVSMIICLLFQEVMQMLLRRTIESRHDDQAEMMLLSTNTGS